MKGQIESMSEDKNEMKEQNENKNKNRIQIRNLKKLYRIENEDIAVLDGIHLDIRSGEITVLLGRSGCGKTTLLRLIAGLELPDAGEIIRHDMKPAIVFQEPRLMPWLDVYHNTIFGLQKEESHSRSEEIEKILDIVGLKKFQHSYPAQLSGGMQARCALARALAVKQSFLLMDEPFAALDYFTRESMQKELLRVQQTLGTGILFVTHSVDEALLLADHIVILGDGKIKGIFDFNTVSGEQSPTGESYKLHRDVMSLEMQKYRNAILRLLAKENNMFSSL